MFHLIQLISVEWAFSAHNPSRCTVVSSVGLYRISLMYCAMVEWLEWKS